MTNTGRERILNWFKRVTESGSFRRFDDLHVDEVESDARERSKWIEKGIEYLKFSASVRDVHKIPFVVALGIGLVSDAKGRGINFDSKEALEREMDDSPPSLYLFDEKQLEKIFVPQNKVQIPYLHLPTSNECFFLEWKDDKEITYRRSLSITA